MRACNGGCCRKSWAVPVTESEAVTHADVVEASAAHGWKYVGHIRKKADGACVLLGGDLCSRYDQRPEVCRQWASEFECRICWPTQ